MNVIQIGFTALTCLIVARIAKQPIAQLVWVMNGDIGGTFSSKLNLVSTIDRFSFISKFAIS